MTGEAAVRDQDRIRRHMVVQLLHDAAHVDGLFFRQQPVRRFVGPFLHPGRHLGHVIRPRRFLRRRAIRQLGGDIIEPDRGVAPKRDLGPRRPAEFFFQDIEVNERHIARQQVVALRRNFTKFTAHGEQTIRRFNKIVGDPRIASEQTGVELAGARDTAFTAHRMGDGHVETFREVCEAVPRFRR